MIGQHDFGGNEAVQKEYLETVILFRNVFSTNDGRKVLQILLNDMHYGQTVTSDAEQVMQNYSVRLLELLGVLHEQNINKLVDGLLDLPKPVIRSKNDSSDEPGTEREYLLNPRDS